MNEDPRDNSTMLGLAAIAVLACAVLALPAASQREGGVEDAFATTSTLEDGERDWLQTEQPGEQVLRRGGRMNKIDQASAKRRAEEAELDALVQRSEEAVQKSRHAAAQLEASARALRHATDSQSAAAAPEALPARTPR